MATISSPRASSPAATPRITSPSIASVNSPLGTPTSSHRSSLDYTRDPTTPTAKDPTPKPARRNRAALRDYYNLKPHAPSTPIQRTASITSTISNSTTTTVTDLDTPTATNLPASLDTPSFSPQTFIDSLLKTASLTDLLKTEGALISEIRTLDGERKALVYDNYSKLIAAVGTLAEMQRGMQTGLGGGAIGVGTGAKGGDMARLEGKFEGLEVLVKEMAPEGGSADEDDEEEEELRRQQETVRWALGAPERLERLEGEEQEKEWVEIKRLLDEWDGVEGVVELGKACVDAMQHRHREDQDGTGG
jgi:vacuolar protein sorting-associated protein 51